MTEYRVSTKTIIACSNVGFIVQPLFERLTIGKPNPKGDLFIKGVYYKNEFKGDCMRKKKKQSFRNAVNVIVQLNVNKCINCKISKNGRFQLTGCKEEKQACDVIKFLIMHFDKNMPDTMIRTGDVNIYFHTVMTNIDFSLGFNIDRQKLYLKLADSSYHNLMETSFGYTGINIKVPLNKDYQQMLIPVLTWSKDQWIESMDKLINTPISIHHRTKYNTFLVFHSGNVIMSGMCQETMLNDFESFYNNMMSWKESIREIIEA